MALSLLAKLATLAVAIVAEIKSDAISSSRTVVREDADDAVLREFIIMLLNVYYNLAA